MTRRFNRYLTPFALLLASAACGSDSSAAVPAAATVAADEPSATSLTAPSSQVAPTAEVTSFTVEVWADNWFSLYINGELVGEDSVPITTERSFNAETITFQASYPLTVAMITKDYKETDSGLEYIGTDRQQMGDGGFIAQITDDTTNEVVAVTSSAWRALAIQQAPLNPDCVTSADPDGDCQFSALDEPVDWLTPGFDDALWPTASVYSAEQVGTKEGYNDISWSPAAALIWGADLQIDNTILWRYTTG
jgi:hypothetical protein